MSEIENRNAREDNRNYTEYIAIKIENSVTVLTDL